MADPAAAQFDRQYADGHAERSPGIAARSDHADSIGAIANASGAQVYSVEAAATYGPFIVQGEYFWSNVDRTGNTGVPMIGAPSLKFQGGYAQAGYVLTGEGRTYNAASGAYGGVKPANPFSLDGGGWGAWEAALLDDRPQRSALDGERRRRRPADGLYARAQLVRQWQRPPHAGLSARHRVAAGLAGSNC